MHENYIKTSQASTIPFIRKSEFRIANIKRIFAYISLLMYLSDIINYFLRAI